MARVDRKMGPGDVVVAGVARTERGDVVLERRTLAVGDDATRDDRLGAFDLVEDGGHVVRVAADESTVVLPELTRSGAWGELEPLEEAAPFRARAPAPHERATLRLATVQNGARVWVVGRPTGHRRVDGDGYRGPGSERVSSLDAWLVAYGPDAEAIATATQPAPPRGLVGERTALRTRAIGRGEAVVLVLGTASAIAGAACAVVLRSAALTADLACIAAGAFLFALVRAYQRVARLSFYSPGGGPVDPRSWSEGMPGFVLGSMGLMVGGLDLLADWFAHGAPDTNAAPASLFALAAFVALWLVDLVRSGRASATHARALLAAPVASAPWTDGAFAAVAGTIAPVGAGATPVLGELVPLAATLQEDWNDGSGANIEAYRVHAAAFGVDTSWGPVRVEPGACFTALDAREGEGAASGVKKTTTRAAWVAPAGSPVLVAGRMRDAGVLPHGMGRTSLLVAAGVPGRPVRVALHARLATRALLLAFLVALTGATGWAAWTHPLLPPFALPADD